MIQIPPQNTTVPAFLGRPYVPSFAAVSTVEWFISNLEINKSEQGCRYHSNSNPPYD